MKIARPNFSVRLPPLASEVSVWQTSITYSRQSSITPTYILCMIAWRLVKERNTNRNFIKEEGELKGKKSEGAKKLDSASSGKQHFLKHAGLK